MYKAGQEQQPGPDADEQAASADKKSGDDQEVTDVDFEEVK